MTDTEDRAREVLQASKREVVDALTARDIKDLHEEIDALRAKVLALEGDRQKALLWGVMVLGAAVLAMAGWIFKLLTAKVGM